MAYCICESLAMYGVNVFSKSVGNILLYRESYRDFKSWGCQAYVFFSLAFCIFCVLFEVFCLSRFHCLIFLSNVFTVLFYTDVWNPPEITSGNDVRLKINSVFFHSSGEVSPHHLVPSVPVDAKCVLSCVLISHTPKSLFLDFSLRSIDLFAHVSCPPRFIPICFVPNTGRESPPPPPPFLPFLSFLVLPFLFKMNFRFRLSISLKIYVELLIVVSLNV